MLELVTVEGAVVALGAAGAGRVAVSGTDCAKAGKARADAIRAPMIVERMDISSKRLKRGEMPCNVPQGNFVPLQPSWAE